MNKVLKQDIDDFAASFPLYNELRGKQVLVTGATGLLGSCMVRCLLALNKEYSLGLKVTAAVRNITKAKALFGDETDSLHYYIYNFGYEGDFCPAFEPDFIVHFASPTESKFFVEHPVETMITGINGTEAVLKYMLNHRKTVMAYISSLEVYGVVTDDSEPLTEDKQGYLDPMQTRSGYPMAKRAVECLCKGYSAEYGLHTRVARLAQTFGAGVAANDNRVFAQFARNIINNENIVLHTEGKLCRCYCYTMDAISSILYILLKGKDGEAYNVANEDSYISIIDMAKMLCKEFNPSVKPVIELRDNMGYSPTTKLRLSTAKMKELGWAPQYSLKRMFERLIDYLKEVNHQ